MRLIAIIAIMCTSATAAAQEKQAATSDLRVTQRVFDNFTQAYDGEPKVTISATGIENLTTVPLGKTWNAYGRGELLMYERFGASPLVGGGVRHDGRRQMFDGSLQGEFKRPIVDIDDTVSEASSLVANAQYGVRPTHPLLVAVSATYRRDAFERETLNSKTYDMGSWIRYQVSGRKFMPSAGLGSAKRNSVNPGDDYSQREGFVRVQSEFSGLRLSARYRHRERDYTVPDLRSHNFDRHDTRQQVTVSAEVPVYKDLAAVAYYTVERSRSTRIAHDFRTQMFSIGLSWRVSWLPQPPEPPEVR